MSISDILVHVDTSPGCRMRLWLATQIAQRFKAYLIAVGSDDAALAEERFTAMLAEEDLRGEWRTAVGLVASYVARAARASDLVV
ncbi:MAG TPA: universal stress protein, partial [Stellaceae bacterium]